MKKAIEDLIKEPEVGSENYEERKARW